MLLNMYGLCFVKDKSITCSSRQSSRYVKVCVLQKDEICGCLKLICEGSCDSDHLVALLVITAITERALGDVSSSLPISYYNMPPVCI